MENLLKNLREHLSKMIEEIDNYTHANSDDIIIKNNDFKYLKHEIGPIFSNSVEFFSYKDEICFRFIKQNEYQKRLYEKIMQGKLDSLILIKREKALTYGGFRLEVQYDIESEKNTLLRKAYRPLKEDKGENE